MLGQGSPGQSDSVVDIGMTRAASFFSRSWISMHYFPDHHRSWIM